MTRDELQALIYDAIGITARHDVVATILLAADAYAARQVTQTLDEIASEFTRKVGQ